ncbi:MAG: glycosyl hydrolase family 18 protein [Promethearchaeota archaeon]
MKYRGNSIKIVLLFFIFLFSMAIFTNDSVNNGPIDNGNYNKHVEYNLNEHLSTKGLKSSQIPIKNKYSRGAAYGYAYRWYNSRNPHYNDYSSSGGDCANFASQCIIAGGISLHKGTDGKGTGVYPDIIHSNSTSNGTIPYCDFLNLNLKNYQNTTIEYVTDTNASIPSYIDIGDVVIFGDKTGDKYKHAMIIIYKNDTDVGLAAHSSDVWNRSFYTELSYFSCATFYHFNDEPASYYHFVVNTAALNVRVGPSIKEITGSNYQAIGQIHDGEEYIAFEYALDGNNKTWWHFWFDDRPAWCAAWYTENVSGHTPFEVNVSNYLNVRNGPSTSYAIFGQVYDGMRFVSYEESSGWKHFYYEGTSKYCSGLYTTDLNETYYYDSGKTSNKTVMGFLPYWVSSSQNFKPLTYLAWFSVEMNADGTLGNKHGWPDWTTINNVHQAGRQIVLTATMFDSTDIHDLISNSTRINTAVNNLLNEVQNGNADGISIDFEHPKTSGDDVYLINFMSALYTTFKAARSDYHVSLCTPSVDWWGTYNYSGLSPYVDAFFLMGYGYYYAGSSNAGPTSPLEGGTYNINKSVNDHINGGAPKSKIILGLPFYGYDYPVQDTSKQASTNGSGSSITYTSNLNKIDTEDPLIHYDDVYEAPWYIYYSSSEGTWHQVWCDNYNSLSKKMDYIIDRDLGGLGIWAWGYQGSHSELEDLIIRKFHADTTPPSVNITYPLNSTQITTNQTNTLIIFAWNASDNVNISRFEYSLNSTNNWTDIGLNYSVQLNLTAGNYTFYVKAIDTSQNTNIANVSIEIIYQEPDTMPPSINILSPINSTEITINETHTLITFRWSASDNINISRFEYSLNATNNWTDIGLNYSIQLDLTTGNYTFYIKAIDTSNNYAIAHISFRIINANSTSSNNNNNNNNNDNDNDNDNNNTGILLIKEVLPIVIGASIVALTTLIIVKKKKNNREPESFVIKT